MRLLVVFFALLTIQVSAQREFDSFTYESHDFSPNALQSPFMDSVGFSSCYHWRWLFNELKFVDKNNLGHFVTEHNLVQINDVQAVEEFNKLYFALNDFQALVDAQTRVIKDGKVLFTATKKDATEINTEEGRYMQLAVENVTPGCYIETIKVSQRSVNRPGNFNIQFTVPIRDFKSIYYTINTIGVKAHINGFEGSCTSELVDDRYISYFSMENVPALQLESYATEKSCRGRIDYAYANVPGGSYTETKWSDKGNTVFANFTTGFEEAKGPIKKMLKSEGISSKATEFEKIFALENYLKQNFELGDDYNYKSFPADEFKTHTITNFNMNRLYTMSLQLLEIPFEIVLTGDRTEILLERDFVSDDYIETVLFYFPTLDMYSEPTDQTSRIPNISGSYYDQDAVHIKLVELGGTVNPVSVIKHIPVNDPESSKISEDYVVKFESGMTNTITQYKRSYSGAAEGGLRLVGFFMSEEDAKKMYEDIIKSGQANAAVTELAYRNYNLENIEEMQAPFEVSATLTGADLLEFAGDQVLFHVGMIIGQQSELYNEKPRQNPIDVSYAHRYERSIVVEIPEGYTAGGLEPLKQTITCEKDGKVLAQFVSNYQVNGNQIKITIDESYFAIRLPKELYGTFSKVINAAADFNKIDLVLTKK